MPAANHHPDKRQYGKNRSCTAVGGRELKLPATNLPLRVRWLAIHAAVAVVMSSILYSPVSTAQDKLSKFLLIKISREQSAVLCKSEVFTQCMQFDEVRCLALSEKAVEKCLEPLPDTINLAELENDTLESCPRQVYEDAGFAETKAQDCLKEAMK